MTKKEFIELINDVPDDWDIVFRTNSERLDVCIPLDEKHLGVKTQCVNLEQIVEAQCLFPMLKCEPLYKEAIVIDAIPYDYLENKYHINIKI